MARMIIAIRAIKRRNNAVQLNDADAEAFGSEMRAEKRTEVRAVLLQTLRDIGGTAALRVLERAAHDDPSEGNRRDATLFVGSIAGTEVAFFKKQTKDPSRWVKLSAYEQLAANGDASGHGLALAALNSAVGSAERQEAIWVLGEIGNAGDAGVLEAISKSSKEALSTRFLAEEAAHTIALKQIPADQQVAYLVKTLDDDSPTVRHWAANRLLRSPDSSMREKLTRYVGEPGHKGYSEAGFVLHAHQR